MISENTFLTNLKFVSLFFSLQPSLVKKNPFGKGRVGWYVCLLSLRENWPCSKNQLLPDLIRSRTDCTSAVKHNTLWPVYSNHLAVWSQSYFNCESLCCELGGYLRRPISCGLAGSSWSSVGHFLQGLYSHSWGWGWFQRLATVSKWNLLLHITLIHLTSDKAFLSREGRVRVLQCVPGRLPYPWAPSEGTGLLAQSECYTRARAPTPRSRLLSSILYTANPHAIVWWGSKVPLPCC